MGILVKGEYASPARTFATDGLYGNLQIDKNGRLLVATGAAAPGTPVFVAGAGSPTGDIGTVAATAKVLVTFDCSTSLAYRVQWVVSINKNWSYQLTMAHANPLGGTTTAVTPPSAGNLAAVYLQGAAVTGKVATSTYAGEIVDQYVDGWEWPAILITNNDGANAATVVVYAIRL